METNKATSQFLCHLILISLTLGFSGCGKKLGKVSTKVIGSIFNPLSGQNSVAGTGASATGTNVAKITIIYDINRVPTDGSFKVKFAQSSVALSTALNNIGLFKGSGSIQTIMYNRVLGNVTQVSGTTNEFLFKPKTHLETNQDYTLAANGNLSGPLDSSNLTTAVFHTSTVAAGSGTGEGTEEEEEEETQGEVLKIISSVPAAGSSSFNINSTISVTLNQEVSLDKVKSNFALYQSLGSPDFQEVPLTMTAVSGDKFTFNLNPTSALVAQKSYTLIYHKYLKGLVQPIAEEDVGLLEFATKAGPVETETPVYGPVTLSQVFPTNNQTHIPLNAQIFIVIDKSVPVAALTENFRMVDANFQTVPGTLTFNTSTLKLLFVPMAPLAAGAVYHYGMNTNLTGLTSVASADFKASFSTLPAEEEEEEEELEVTKAFPADGAVEVAATTAIYVNLNKAITLQKAQSNFVVVDEDYKQVTGSVAFATTNNVHKLSFTPTSALKGGVTYYMAMNTRLTGLTEVDQADFVSRFTLENDESQQDLQVLSSTPSDNGRDVALDVKVRVTVNRAVPLTEMEKNLALVNKKYLMQVKGKLTTTDNLTFTLTPDTQLLPETEYVIAMNTRLEGLDASDVSSANLLIDFITKAAPQPDYYYTPCPNVPAPAGGKVDRLAFMNSKFHGIVFNVDGAVTEYRALTSGKWYYSTDGRGCLFQVVTGSNGNQEIKNERKYN